MAKKINARELLNEVLVLISRDIEEIDKLSTQGKLEADVSASLVRYSDALLKITKDADTQDENEKSKLANLSTAELAAKAQQFLNKAK